MPKKILFDGIFAKTKLHFHYLSRTSDCKQLLLRLLNKLIVIHYRFAN